VREKGKKRKEYSFPFQYPSQRGKKGDSQHLLVEGGEPRKKKILSITFSLLGRRGREGKLSRETLS